jgi:hypothetical protein
LIGCFSSPTTCDPIGNIPKLDIATATTIPTNDQLFFDNQKSGAGDCNMIPAKAFQATEELGGKNQQAGDSYDNRS